MSDAEEEPTTAEASSQMEDEALKRKQRLAKMKRKIEGKSEEDHSNEEQQIKMKRPVFRSYNPQNEALVEKSVILPAAKPVELDAEIPDQLAASKHTVVMDEMDLTTLAPRKIDWDLKRDALPKLEKLERRTARAIAELIRDRLASGVTQDLLTAVNVSTDATQRAHLSDEDDD